MMVMAEQARFTYGDTVQVLDGEHAGRIGEIVAVPSEAFGTYTVEFGDGTDAQVEGRSLREEQHDLNR